LLITLTRGEAGFSGAALVESLPALLQYKWEQTLKAKSKAATPLPN
jgi:hypothetical protein